MTLLIRFRGQPQRTTRSPDPTPGAGAGRSLDGRAGRGSRSPGPLGGALYLQVSTILPASDAALDELRAGAELRLRAQGRVHPLRAIELTTGAEIDPILPTLVRETLAIEATGLRWDPEPARYPGTQIRQWFFRLEPAAG